MSSFSGQVTSNNDAGEQGALNSSPGTVAVGNTTYKIKGSSTGERYMAFRFLNVTIPQGATISAASLSIYASGAAALSLSGCTVECEAADNSAALSSSSTNISSRTKSTHSTSWSATLTQSVFNASPDISAAINDVISRPGWVSGNALTVIMDDGTGQASNLSIAGYADSPSFAATISITYTSGNPQTIQVSASSDDAFENTLGNVTTTDSTDTLVTADRLGFRFLNCQAPAGAEITSAYLTVYLASVAGIGGTVSIDAQNSATPATFTAGTGNTNISSRTLTGQATSWSIAALSSGSNQSPSIAPAIQAVVNLPAYSINDNIVVVITGGTLAAGFDVQMYDGSATLAAQLTLGWKTAPSALVSDTIVSTDSVKPLASRLRNVNDPIALTDIAKGLRASLIPVADAIALTDSEFVRTIWRRVFSDNVELSEFPLLGAFWRRLFADAVQVTDWPAWQAILYRSFADAIAVSDSKTLNVVWNRVINSQMTIRVTDETSYSRIVSLLLSEPIEVGDRDSVLTVYRKLIADSIEMSEGPFRVSECFYRTLKDNAVITEFIADADINGVKLASVADTVVLTDPGPTFIRAILRVASDTLALNDGTISAADFPGWNLQLADQVEVIARGPSLFVPAHWMVVISEMIAAVDFVASPILISKNIRISDSVVASDKLISQVLWRRVAKDILATTESVSRSQIAYRMVADLIDLSEDVSHSATFYRKLSESIAVGDFGTFYRVIYLLLHETLVVTDKPGTSTISRRKFSDPIAISDLATKHAILLRMVSDTLGITDQVQNGLIALRTMADAVAITDRPRVSSAWRRTLADTLEVSDKASKTLIALRAVGDAVLLADFLSARTIAGRKVTDPVQATDTVEHRAILYRLFTDYLAVSDNPELSTIARRAFTDAIEVSDRFSQTAIFLRQFADAFVLSESLQSIDISDGSGYTDGETVALQGYVDGAETLEAYVDGVEELQ